MRDVIIIGAGPAGLQAALTLGRMHRTALLVDSGEYRNGAVLHMHNVIGNDGTSPADFRSTVRAELSAYATIEATAGTVDRVEALDGGYRATFADGREERATRLLLATGMVDELPPVDGLDRLWGLRAFSCPFCDGHEFAGRTIGLLGSGARFAHLVRLLRPIVEGIVVFGGDELSGEERDALTSLGATVHAQAASAVAEHGDGVRVTAGESVDVAGLFVTVTGSRQRADFATQLGLTMLPSGAIEVDDFGRTSLPGVSAAGDLAHRASMPGAMASVVAATAAGQLAGAFIVQELAV
ncbi:NAD(P)/FAD-dependent oxidoreductase [Microbacterium sp. NPDC058342]|uniref:NAD(P)/FAD-dependent oxidoreductase n=1 Tax=Microbacterium sp. NPDC058342 TaxID=3346454 RepID=UPI00364EB45F